MRTEPKPSPPGSYAWCGDCDWRDETEWCEANARLHSASLMHIVHMWEQDVCGDPMIESFGQTHNCSRPPGHEPPHRCTSHERTVEW